MSPKIKFALLVAVSTIVIYNVSKAAAAKDSNSLLGKLSTLGA